MIQRELRLLQAQKPVVVSMGSVAASGGYWISAYADRIFAEPSTITGSIGVIGMLFNVKELSQKVGVSFDVVKTGKFADTETLSRPKTEEELRAIQSVVDWLYESFIERVAQGRKLDTARVREIAEGRVWSGSDAKRLGLIDEFGGLEAAIDHAAQRAQLGRTYRLQEYPRKRELGEILQEFFEDSSDYLSRGRIEGRILGRVRREVRALEQYNDPRNVYLRLPVELQLN